MEPSMAFEMPTPTQRCTGYFIPIEIAELTTISWAEKILLSIIDSLYDKERGGCFASNEFLAKKMMMDNSSSFRNMITNLRKLKLIEDVSYDGRVRVIKSLIYRNVDQIQKQETGSQTAGNPAEGCRNSGSPTYYRVKREKNYSCEKSHALASLFFDHLKSINPKIIKPKLDKWASVFDKMLRLDERSEEEIKQAIAWIKEHHDKATGEFSWGKVINSADKFRKHFATIWLQMTKPSQETLKKKQVEKKVDISKENKAWVENLLHESVLNDILIADKDVLWMQEAKGVRNPLSYQENGFKDQVNNFIRRKKYSL